MSLFTSNPFMYKVQYINGDRIETATNVSSVLGSAVHKGLEVYYKHDGQNSEAYKCGMEAGIAYIETVFDGMIKYSDSIKNRAELQEDFLLSYKSYISETGEKKRIKEIVFVEKMLKHKISVDGKLLPVPLKSAADLVFINHKGELEIEDHKIVSRFSSEDEIDGKKLIQAVINFFNVYAETGIEPTKFTFNELKRTKNRDNSSQLSRYTIVYKDHPLMFDFFYRLYEDINRALLGESVFIPNLSTMFDKEVSVIAYAHRLDIENYKEEGLQRYKVSNLTELLKEKIQNAGAMKKYLDTVEKTFISAKTLNYNDMNFEERIKMKLAEHGMAVEFDSKIVGPAFTQYRFETMSGIKMSKLLQYKLDIEQVLGVTGVRILAPIPETQLVGFEVKNELRTFIEKSGETPAGQIAVGENILGEKVFLNVEDMPHLLVAGTTGSGKSVFLNSVYSQLKKDFNFIILDPKGVEFPDGIKDHKDSALVLSGLVDEMENRYEKMRGSKVKKWSETGEKSTIVLIDEYNDLYMSKTPYQTGIKEDVKVYKNAVKKVKKPVYEPTGSVIERQVKTLAQKARAAGIHIILATQRPSVKVIDGDIKANFPTRICFALPTNTDSKVVLDQEGAETLLGKGDGLLLKEGKITRFQGYNI